MYSVKWLKIIAAAVSLCMALTLTACNRETEESSSDSSMSDEEQTTPHKVGYIFHGKTDDFSFTSQMSEQRVLASNRSSVETCYIDGVDVIDFEKAVKKLVDNGCTDIVSCNAAFSNVLASVAGKYMNINFIGYGRTTGSSNLAPYTEQSFEGAYVAGMVAAYNSTSRKIGFIADRDLIYVNATMNAAALGTQLVFENAQLYGAFATRDSEIRQGIDELITRGCDVVVCYTASDYAEEYCQQRGIKFISNLDMSARTDEFSKMLMYYYCKRDSYFLSQFKQLKMDSWGAEEFVGTMANGIVNVSPALENACADKTQDIMNALVSKITGGINIFSGQLIDNEDVPRYLQSDEMSYSEIYTMDWYVKGVTIVGNYRLPQNKEVENPLDIKT